MNDQETMQWLIKDLAYERRMLDHDLERMRETEDRLDWNSFHGSFLIRARCIYEFLRGDPEPAHKPRTFAPNFKVAKGVNRKIPGRVGSQVFHIGSTRSEDQKITFQHCEEFYRWLTREFERFVENLDEPYKSAWGRGPSEKPDAVQGRPDHNWTTTSFRMYSSHLPAGGPVSVTLKEDK